ncbi:cupin domain-containing protein [bacterium]|nr:cupin domain-containing protein [bacterium]
MIRSAHQMKKEERVAMRGGKGAITITHAFTKEDLRSATRLCARLTIPPGASIGPHAHEGEEEVFCILSGRGRVDDNGTIADVGPGDAILTGGGARHAIENTGAEPLEVMAFIGCYPK